MAKINKNIENVYQLTPLQAGMLFHSIYDKRSTAYVVQNVFSVDYNMDNKSISQALELLSRRYSILRTAFIYEGMKDIYQVVLSERFPEMKYYDFIELKNEIKKEKLDNIILDDIKRGFDLKNDTLIRVIHIRYADGIDKIIFNMHHIIADGWCCQKLFSDFYNYYLQLKTGKSYKVLESEIENERNLSSDYGEYIKWLEKQDKEKAKKYWQKEMESYDNVIDIRPMKIPESTEDQCRKCFVKLNKKTTEKLKLLARKAGSTINIAAETAVGIMLQRYSGSNDVVFGKVVSGRNADIPGIEDMVGLFINTIPLRVEAGKDETIIGLLKKQQKKSIESANYDYYSLAEIQNMTIQGAELIKVLYVFENYDSGLKNDALSNTGITVESSREKTNYEIAIAVYDEDGEIIFNILYDPNKYCEEEVRLILERLKKICEEMVEKPNAKVSEIKTITESEKQLILNDFNATESEYPRDKTIVELFEEQVKKSPDNTAVIFEGQKFTYAELNARANSLAHKLRELGVKPDDFVAIIADRSIEMIAGIYGIIKAGGAYVPIDPTYPEDRIKYMFEDCAPKAAVIYTLENINIPENIKVVDLADSSVWEYGNENLEFVNKPSDLAYCIYTSGTTGTPKGTMLEHHGVVNLKYYFANRMGINENDRVLQFANYIFDASVWEMTMALLNGAALVCVPTGLAQDTKAFNEYCAKNKVTVATLPPNYYVQEDVKLNLRLIITAGSESNKFILEKSKNSDYINAYGPTETTVCATYWKRPEGFDEATAPIGVPIDNFQAFIMNGNNLCGIGVPGELCIAGDGLARGYLNRPELTAEKFVKNPFGEDRMYRTGDLARWLPDGNIDFLGRIDEQVKIRGFRIELGEIESRIREIESIKDCAVIAKADARGDKAIYAYYTSESKVSISEIKDRLSNNLPDYMMPAYMMQIDEIPMTRNGKLDKKALPEIESKSTREYIAPRNKAEEAVCAAFCEIINVEKIGIQDSFFELGGDSIKAIRIISKLRNSGYNVTVKDIMIGKTPEKIALYVKNADEKRNYEQGEVTGKVESTPIIKKFGEWALVKPEHYNQSAMISVDEIDNRVIHEAVNELVKHHDILRAVYRNKELEILPIAENKLCDFYEFDYSNEADKHKAVENKCDEIQESIDLEQGPLIKVAVFELGETKQMMFCIHHLAIDGISWRILQEDFETAVSQIKAGKKVILPEKTASFIEWSQKLKEYGEKLESKEKEYWKNTSAKISEGHVVIEYSQTEIGHAVAEFSKETTEKLLTKSSNAYDAKIDEVLLAGLARAVGRITGQKNVAVMIEGHGREEIHEPINIDRTVGWFTNIYAVSLVYSEDNDEAIINAKDTMRSIPNMGMGYGYVKHDAEPEITFNYLGYFSERRTDFANEYSTGNNISKDNNTEDKISLNGLVSEGRLVFSILSKYGKEFAVLLKTEFEKSVNEFAEYCAASRNSSKMANDNIVNNKSNIKLTYDQFIFKNTIDERLAEYNCEDIASEYVKQITEKEIINLYKPSYTQKHFYEMDNNVIIAKLSAYNINSNDVISILNELIRTQEVFRTAYDINIDKMKVYNYSKIEIPILNNINNEKWISSIFTTYKGGILNKGGLLSRIFVVKNDYNQFDIYFIYHHSISDGTSGSIIPELFNNIAIGNKNDYLPKRSFSDVIVGKRKLSKNYENKIKVEDFKKALEKFNNALKNEKYKYAYIEMKKKCSKAEIAVINNNNLKWLIDTMLELLPDELRDYIDNRLPFILIHNGRTSLDYSTLGMFLSLIIGTYNSENSIDSIIKELADYRIKDLDIPDHLEALTDQLLHEMKMVPFFNVQIRTDFNVEKDSLMVTTTDKFLPEVALMMNNDQIYIKIPVLYKNMDNLKEKIFSSFKMKGVYSENK